MRLGGCHGRDGARAANHRRKYAEMSRTKSGAKAFVALGRTDEGLADL